MSETVGPDSKPDGWVSKLAVVFEGLPDDGIPEFELKRLIDDSLDHCDIVLDDDSDVGYVDGWLQSDPYGECGGRIVSDWVDTQNGMGRLLGRHGVETPWSRYEPIFGWYDDDHAVVPQPANRPANPEEAPPLHEIPFDTSGYRDVEPWMPASERTRAMVEWADEVVVVTAGGYEDSWEYECQSQDVPCDIVFDIELVDDDVHISEHTEADEPEQVELSEHDPIAGTEEKPTGTDSVADDNVWVPLFGDSDDDLDNEEKPRYETDYDSDGPNRPGSPDELDPEDAFEVGVTTRDEHWPDEDETGGGGVGSKDSSVTGDWVQYGE